jgi:hypothetical protein
MKGYLFHESSILANRHLGVAVTNTERPITTKVPRAEPHIFNSIFSARRRRLWSAQTQQCLQQRQ